MGENQDDNERFKTTILQIAANEAKHGHDTFARELKQYAEKVGKGKRDTDCSCFSLCFTFSHWQRQSISVAAAESILQFPLIRTEPVLLQLLRGIIIR